MVKQTKPQRELYVIDAADTLVGRLATQAAKEAMHGKDVRIINCERAAISGTKAFLVTEWKRRYAQGVPRKGPYIHRFPDRMVRRIIRGMLSHHNPRGREAFEHTMCYIGVPTELKGVKAVIIPEAQTNKLPLNKFMTMGDLCKEIGGRWHE